MPLDVHARAERGRRADQDAHLARVHAVEELLAPQLVVARVGDSGDLLVGDTEGAEATPKVVVDVPSAARRGRCVAEDELRPPVLGGERPFPVDPVRALLDLSVIERVYIGVVRGEELRVECELPSLARDLEHVVLLGPYLAVTDSVCPHGKLAHERALAVRGLHRNGDALDVRHVEVEVFGGEDVREVVEGGHELWQVVEAREALLYLEAVSLGADLHGVHDLAVDRGPCGEGGATRGLEEAWREVALEVVELAHGVGDGRAGGEDDVGTEPLFAEVGALVEQILALL